MKRIAVLMPGHIRSYSSTRENIYDKLIGPLRDAGYMVDIFSSLWNTDGYREQGWVGCIEGDALGSITEDSKCMELEQFNRDLFINKYNNNKWVGYAHLSGPETCGDAVSMWYKVSRCFRLIPSHYDVVFRLRPDIFFGSIFDTSLIEDISPNTVYMSDWHGKYQEVTHQIMDHFGFGDYDSMKTYCSVYDDIDRIIERNDFAFTAEGFLRSQLDFNKISISRVNIKYGVIRYGGLLEAVTV